MSDSDKPHQIQVSSESAGKWKLISFLLAGVLIPIVAALLPWGLDHWVPKNRLSYSITGPIDATDPKTAAKAFSFSVHVKNEGRAPQQNVEVWIPMRIVSKTTPTVTSDGQVEWNEIEPNIILSTSVEPTNEAPKDNFTVLYYDTLRPGESVDITLFIVGGQIFLTAYDLQRMRIVSDETMAQLNERSEIVEDMYRAAAVLLVVLLIFVLVYGVYYEYFMPVEKKRAELLKQLEKLDSGKSI